MDLEGTDGRERGEVIFELAIFMFMIRNVVKGNNHLLGDYVVDYVMVCRIIVSLNTVDLYIFYGPS